MIIFSIPAMLRFADTTAVDSAAAEPNRGGLGHAVACHPDAVLLANTTRYTHRRRPSSPRTAVDQPPPTPSSVKRVAGRRRRGDRSVGSQRVARPAVAAVVFTSTQPIPSCGSVCGGSHVGPAQTSSATLIEGRQQSAPSSGPAQRGPAGLEPSPGSTQPPSRSTARPAPIVFVLLKGTQATSPRCQDVDVAPPHGCVVSRLPLRGLPTVATEQLYKLVGT